MKTKSIHSAILTLSLAAAVSLSDTTQTDTHVYVVDEGVTFTLTSFLADAWVFSWTDDTGTYQDIHDPTLVLSSGQTYIFSNFSTHPYAITDSTLPVDGTDGTYFRTSVDGVVIDEATHDPIADFSDSPVIPDDFITWVIDDSYLGDNFYTCRNIGHIDMTGRIEVIEAAQSCNADLTGDGELNFFDVSAFLSAFSSMDQAADFTGDSQFNFFDVSAFLEAFGDGCP